MKEAQYEVLVDVDAALLAVWKLFHYSPSRFAVFKGIQEAYGDRPLTIIRAATTRWLSHGKACVRFVDRYTQILDTLDAIYTKKKEPEVFGLRIAVTKKENMAMILLLCDVLKIVNILSMYLQSSEICLNDVSEKVTTTTNQLSELITLLERRDPDLYFSKISDIYDEINDRTELQRRLRGDQINVDPDEFLKKVGIPFIHSLINEIADAFHCNPVFSAFKALDPRCLPDTVEDLTEYGKVIYCLY